MTPPLPAVDTVAAAREAEAAVNSARADLTDPEQVAVAMRQLIDAATLELGAVRGRRDELALSIREYGPDATEAVPRAVRNVRLAEAVGVSKARLQHLRVQHAEKYGTAPVPFHADARAELPGAAYRAQVLEHMLSMAREVRDIAAGELMDAGWRNIDVARVIGCHPSWVVQLRARIAS